MRGQGKVSGQVLEQVQGGGWVQKIGLQELGVGQQPGVRLE